MVIRRLVAAALSIVFAASGVPLSAQTDHTWARVRRMQPGREIVFTVRGAPEARHRHFVSATDAELVVLNLSDATLGRAEMRRIIEFASKHPEAFTAMRPTEVIGGEVHVVSGGVLVSGQRVADLAQLVERTARADVVEVITTKHRSKAVSIVKWSAIGAGVFFGFGLLLFTGALPCTSCGG